MIKSNYVWRNLCIMLAALSGGGVSISSDREMFLLGAMFTITWILSILGVMEFNGKIKSEGKED